jgi:hypothetical protein
MSIVSIPPDVFRLYLLVKALYNFSLTTVASILKLLAPEFIAAWWRFFSILNGFLMSA